MVLPIRLSWLDILQPARAFYSQLLPFLGLTIVADTANTFYCVGVRTVSAFMLRLSLTRVRVIATSGCVAFKMLDLPAGTLLFPKPYSLDQIAWTLRALIGC